MVRAGRWFWATYGRFLRLSALCVLFSLASALAADLAYRVSHAALVGMALGILGAACIVAKRERLVATLRRHRMNKSPSSGHRQAKRPI